MQTYYDGFLKGMVDLESEPKSNYLPVGSQFGLHQIPANRLWDASFILIQAANMLSLFS